MKRWFKLVAVGRVEGQVVDLIENGGLYHLGTLFEFCQTGNPQSIGLQPPVNRAYFREVLPAGLSPELYWFNSPYGRHSWKQTELHFQIVPEYELRSPREWPSSSMG